MSEDVRMLRWWNDISVADRDEWCKALAAGDVSEPLAETLATDVRADWLTPAGGAYVLQGDFRVFLESRCGRTDRG